MRTVKEAKERRKEILDVAEYMFSVNGYDNVSTNDIIAKIGIARGTLYYHFKSKEDILDGIIQRVLDDIENKASKVAFDESIPVLERFTQTILCANVDNEVGEMVQELVHKPQNALMHQKMQKSMIETLEPLIVKIVEDGISEGIMQTDYPNELVEMTLLYANTAFDGYYEYSEEEKLHRVKAFIRNVELMLNMQQGSLQEAMIPMFYRK